MTTPPGAVASGETGEEGNLEANNTTMRVELHPLCEIFPRLSSAELDDLAGDIKLHGLRQPITLLGGMILDGGNRYAACNQAGIEPRFVEYDGGNPAAFVLSMNLHRRHLPVGQYAAIVSLTQNWEKAQTVGKPKSGNVTGLARVEDRAAQSGASDKTQRMADKVAKADPVLAKAVAHGEVTLPQAVRQVEQKPAKPAPKPAKASAPIEPEFHESDAVVMSDLAADLERTNTENADLRQRIDALTASDHAAKLNEWITRYHKLEGRLNDALTTSSEAQREATRKGKVLAKIRATLGVDRDSEILPKLKGGV